MNTHVIYLDWFNRLIFGFREIHAKDNGIELDGLLVCYPKPSQRFHLQPGWLFHRIHWHDKDLVFFRTRPLVELFQVARQRRLNYWREEYTPHFGNMVDLSIRFCGDLENRRRYIRHSTFLKFQPLLSDARQLWELKPDFEKLGFDFRQIGADFVRFMECPPEPLVAGWNNQFVQRQSLENQSLFDYLEAQPLTKQQREACVRDEDNVLVIAGAGTGKTSTLCAKAAYLVKQGFAKPEEILMLAYGRDARAELQERVAEFDYLNGVVIRTFHALGMGVIGRYENRAIQVDVMATDAVRFQKFIDEQIEEIVKLESLENALDEFFTSYLYPQPNDLNFKTNTEYLRHVRQNDWRDLAGNMVRSYEELRISNFLFRQGIKFEYEATYPVKVVSPGHKVYQPDYYLPDLDVYIEHFGIDKKGNTRKDIDRDKYHAEMKWKIKMHEEHGTELIQTFSYQNCGRDGLEKALHKALTEHCRKKGIEFDGYLKPVGFKRIFAVLKELKTYQLFSKLIADFLTLFKGSHYQLHNLPEMPASDYNQRRFNLFRKIFAKVLQRYDEFLKQKGTIDFADMLRQLEPIIRQPDFHERTGGRYRFKYIMVDEFQDISQLRANVVNALREVGNHCALFCVGDDWQAIYRFTGSDMQLTTEFERHFGKADLLYLDKTFRFNNRIETVASGFVQNNPAQLKKSLVTHAQSHRTEVHVRTGDREEVFTDILDEIAQDADEESLVLVLSRFKRSCRQVRSLGISHRGLKLEYMSVHSAKGKQADYVVLLDVIDGRYGFPSTIMTDPLLELLLPNLESFSHAEERRLFYVALSRARKSVYIHTCLGEESAFLKELKERRFDVSFDPISLSEFLVEDITCPECITGKLLPRRNRGNGKVFYACSESDGYCSNTVEVCPSCGSAPLVYNDDKYFCVSPDCHHVADFCPSCGTGRLLERINSNDSSRFMACTNFRGDDANSCRYTRNI